MITGFQNTEENIPRSENEQKTMDKTINIKLKPSVFRSLEKKTNELKTNADNVVNKALEDYFYVERLNAMRQQLQGTAKEQGFTNEDDIFEAIS